MDAKLFTRVVRQAFPGRNSLATAGDRVEGAVLVVVVAVVLLALPISGAVGSEYYAAQSIQSAGERQTRQQVAAVLLEDAPPVSGFVDPDGPVESALVFATWRGPDGKQRQGAVRAAHGRKAGGTVPIWVDQDGVPAGAALTTGGAVVKAVVLAVVLWAGVSAVMLALFLAVRCTHKRLRARRWAVEWERISSDWTAR
ncbi:Rv1733c family protein [Lentzea sp. HUAS TT2]|uniref:Rv1733c family protein n=1 Tax=Lentzea sp. HUAS TT2 TaxID=3447454 RepID=UPI003F6E8892